MTLPPLPRRSPSGDLLLLEPPVPLFADCQWICNRNKYIYITKQQCNTLQERVRAIGMEYLCKDFESSLVFPDWNRIHGALFDRMLIAAAINQDTITNALTEWRASLC